MTFVSNETLAAQIEAAKQAAANLVPQTPAPQAAAVPAVQNTQSTAVGLPSAGKRMGLSEFMNSGNADADGFIKIGESGVKFGKDLRGFQNVEFVINLGKDVRFFHTISYGNSPAIYKRSADGIIEQSGGTWAQAVENAQRVDPRARVYESAEIVLELAKDVVAGKDTLASAGSRWGYSTPKTGSKKFRRLLSQAQDQGIDIENDDILVRVGGEPKAGNGNTWNEVTFELVGRASLDGTPLE